MWHASLNNIAISNSHFWIMQWKGAACSVNFHCFHMCEIVQSCQVSTFTKRNSGVGTLKPWWINKNYHTHSLPFFVFWEIWHRRWGKRTKEGEFLLLNSSCHSCSSRSFNQAFYFWSVIRTISKTAEEESLCLFCWLILRDISKGGERNREEGGSREEDVLEEGTKGARDPLSHHIPKKIEPKRKREGERSGEVLVRRSWNMWWQKIQRDLAFRSWWSLMPMMDM